jgi:predicted permease
MAGLKNADTGRAFPSGTNGFVSRVVRFSTMAHFFTNDLRWALRALKRRPVQSTAAAATLAVAMATITTAVGLATAVLWRPLPFAEADRVVFVWEDAATDGAPRPSRVTGSRFADWRDHAKSFDSLSLFGASGFSMEGPDGVRAIRGVRVSANYFTTIGLTPAAGRSFTPDDEVDGRQFVVILSHSLWQQQFGGRLEVIGSSVRLSGQPYTVIGVLPPVVLPAWPVNPASVTMTADSRDYWVPMTRGQADGNTRAHVFGVVGRLAPGVSREQAAAELRGLSSPTAPDPHDAVVRLLRAQLTADARQPLLLVLLSAVAVLMVATANLAAIHLAAFENRRTELATRASLGASLPQLARQVALESLVVAAVGGAAGTGLARAALAWVPAALPPSFPLVTAPALDLTIMLVALGVTLVAGLGLAAAPIARLLTTGPAPRGVTGRPRTGVYGGLVAAQVAGAVALVSAAGLLGQSLWSVQSRDAGFTIDGVATADVALPGDPYQTSAAVVALEDRLRAAIAARPDVAGVAIAYDHPLEANWSGGIAIVGRESRSDDAEPIQLRIVSPSYFDAVGVTVLDGRSFADEDDGRREGVAMVNEAFAGMQEPGIIGRVVRSQAARATWGDTTPVDFTIVGVVENERSRGLEEAAPPAVYLSTRQFPQTGFSLVVRSAEPRALLADLRSVVRRVEPGATVESPTLLSQILADQLASRRITSDVLGGFAGSSLLLAGIGVYALLALLVSSQRRDLGVRLALGATPASVAWHVVTRGMRHVLAGLAAGLVLALLAGQLVRGLLVGVSATDPATLALVTTAILAVGGLASALPAVRAARVDAVDALRAE